MTNMKKMVEETLKKHYEESVWKDMMAMGYEEPRITYWGYVKDYVYPEDDSPVLGGWVVANNYANQVSLDLEVGELYYSGCCGILCYL